MPGAVPSDITVKPVTDWLYCLRTPVVAVYAIQQPAGLVLVDCGVVGYERAYLEALGTVAGSPPHDVRITEILLTHGHDDHTRSAAALSALTGARVLGRPLTRMSSREEPNASIRSCSNGRSHCSNALGTSRPRRP